MHIYFALLVSLFLYCVFLIVNIYYGDMVITHISIRPYKISLLLIITNLIMVTIQLIYNDVIWKKESLATND